MIFEVGVILAIAFLGDELESERGVKKRLQRKIALHDTRFIHYCETRSLLLFFFLTAHEEGYTEGHEEACVPHETCVLHTGGKGNEIFANQSPYAEYESRVSFLSS